VCGAKKTIPLRHKEIKTMKHNFIKSLIMASMLSVAADVATAANFSFIGGYNNLPYNGFAQDDQSQFFSFQADGTSTVTLETVSYAGGTLSQSAVTVTGGGFDPMLALFRPNGLVIGQNDDMGPSAQMDSLLSGVLAAGTYWVALTQSLNLVNGIYYDPNSVNNGFTETGNYTGPLYGCSNGQFCDFLGSNRNGDWALNITGVVKAQTETEFKPTPDNQVPEPSSLALLFLGLAVMLKRGPTLS
jgi:hypothetical protein